MGIGGRFLRRRVHPRICEVSPLSQFAEFHTAVGTLQEGALWGLGKTRIGDTARRGTKDFDNLNRVIERISAPIQIIPTFAYSQDLLRTFALPSPYLRPTFALLAPLHPRIS